MTRVILIICICAFTICSSSGQNVGVGVLSPEGKFHIKGTDNVSQLILDADTIQINSSPLIKLRNNIGTDLMWIHSDDSSNVFMGLQTGRANVIGSGGINNTSIGSNAGYSNTSGRDNTIIGARGSYFNSKGSMNTVIGSNALFSQAFGPGGGWFPTRNVAIGYEALYFNQPTNATNGVSNTAVGTGSLRSNTSGYENTAHGTYALTNNITGSRNTALGYSAGVISGNLTNATAIGYNAKVDTSNALVLGGTGFNSVNVGIGTTTPNARLEIIGDLKVVDGTQGAGKILTSDATGLASWQPPPPAPPTYYPSVTICCQSWMTENLDVSTYRNGDPIPKVTSNSEWATLTTGAYCYYNNDSTMYAATYGKLYNWYAVNDTRGLAPEGWHIPSDFEWTSLGSCLGGDVVAGGPLKKIGTTPWNAPNTGATNLSNFTGLPGGSRVSFGAFGNLGYEGAWWSSTEVNPNDAWYRRLYYSNDDLFKYNYDKRDGYSVRCLRD